MLCKIRVVISQYLSPDHRSSKQCQAPSLFHLYFHFHQYFHLSIVFIMVCKPVFLNSSYRNIDFSSCVISPRVSCHIVAQPYICGTVSSALYQFGSSTDDVASSFRNKVSWSFFLLLSISDWSVSIPHRNGAMNSLKYN